MRNAECDGGGLADFGLQRSANRAAPPTVYWSYRTRTRPPLSPSPLPGSPILHSAFLIQHFHLPDLPHLDELLEGLVLVADHVGVGLELALGFHELGELGDGIDVRAFERPAVEGALGTLDR